MFHEDHQPTPAQREVIAYLDGLNLKRLWSSEEAYRSLPAHLQEIFKTIKRTCNKVWLPNARITVCDGLADFIMRLWNQADEFASFTGDKRQQFAKSLAQMSANKAVRRTPECQLLIPGEVDIRVRSNRHTPLNPEPRQTVLDSQQELEPTTDYRKLPTAVTDDDYSPSGHADWKKANSVEDELIAKIDADRAGQSDEPEPETEYERAVRILGDDAADFYWTVKANQELYSQRDPRRGALTAAERKRFQRLKQKLDVTT